MAKQVQSIAGKQVDAIKSISGEEGTVLFLPEPLEFIGTSVVKVFHSNFVHVCGGGKSDSPMLVRRPRFDYSQSRFGFLRLYHVHRLADALLPSQVVDVRGVVVPDVMPKYFDSFDENKPRMKDGRIQYPEMTSKLVPIDEGQEKRLRVVYDLMDRDRNYVLGLFHKRNGVLTKSELDSIRRRRGEGVGVVATYEAWFKGYAARSGLSLAEAELRVMEAGFTQPHGEVNLLLTPPGHKPQRLVLCDLGAYIDEGGVEKAIKNLEKSAGSAPDEKAADALGKRVSAARRHLQKVREYGKLAVDDIRDNWGPEELATTDEFISDRKAFFKNRMRRLREAVAAEKGG